MNLTTTIFEALIPVMALISFGYIFRKKGILPIDFWEGAETLTYYLLFPALIINRLTTTSFENLSIMTILFTVLTFFLLLTLLSYLLHKHVIKTNHASWTSFLQGSIRYNTFIALALSDALFADSLFAVSALLVSLFITIVNTICIICFSIEKTNTTSIAIKNLIKNPLIIASVIGIVINTSNFDLPNYMHKTLSVFGFAALPLALLAVGAGLKMNSLTHLTPSLYVSSIIKLIIAPIVMAMLAFIFITDETTIKLLIIFACVPTASSSYILSRKLGGDAQMMASIITFQTIISALSISGVLYLIL